MLCLMYALSPRASVYISSKALVPVLQLLCVIGFVMATLITRQMPTASRGEPEIKNWTFGVVTHIIITLSNMKLSYASVSRHVPSFLVWCALFRSVSNLRRN